jgi:hypothetical protein
MSSDSDKDDNEDEENARPHQQGGSIFSQPDAPAGLGYRAAFSVHAGSTESKQAASKAHSGVGDDADAISGAGKSDGECPENHISLPFRPDRTPAPRVNLSQ